MKLATRKSYEWDLDVNFQGNGALMATAVGILPVPPHEAVGFVTDAGMLPMKTKFTISSATLSPSALKCFAVHPFHRLTTDFSSCTVFAYMTSPNHAGSAIPALTLLYLCSICSRRQTVQGHSTHRAPHHLCGQHKSGGCEQCCNPPAGLEAVEQEQSDLRSFSTSKFCLCTQCPT